MKTQALVMTTLALGSTALTTGCDKNLPALASLVQKAQGLGPHDLERKAADLLRTGAQRLGIQPAKLGFGDEASATPSDPTPDFAPGYAPGLAMPEVAQGDDAGYVGRIGGNFDLSFAVGPTAGVGDIAAMNRAFDQEFDQVARAASWNLALRIPNDVAPGDLAAALRANADQAAAGEAYIRDQQDQSDRRSDAVDAWDRQVIRGEAE